MLCRVHLPLVLWSALACFLFTSPPTAHANGWEHTAIPLPALFDALQDEHAEIRQRAAHSLGHHRGAEVTRQLLALLERGEPQPSVRQAVFISLGKIGAPAALPSIEKCLMSESEAPVRVACATALSGIVSPRSEQIAGNILADANTVTNSVVQRALLGSLGNYRTPEALQILSHAIQSSDTIFRHTAIVELGNSGHPAGLKYLLPLVQADTDEATLVTTLKAIAGIGGTTAPPTVQQLFNTTGSDRVRRFTLIALAAFDGGTNGLLQALNSDDPLLQIQALEIFREHNDKESIDPIVAIATRYAEAFFDHPVAWVERYPNKAVVELSVLNEFLRTVIAIDPHHADKLFKVVTQPYVVARNRPLLLQVAEGLYRARWHGLYGIGYTHAGTADDVLKRSIADPDARVRAVALRSMGVSDPTRFHSLAVKALNDISAEVRWQAAVVLGRDRTHRNIAPLLAATKDRYARVRKEAALSLGYLGDPQAKTVLTGLAQSDADAQVRASASYALGLLDR